MKFSLSKKLATALVMCTLCACAVPSLACATEGGADTDSAPPTEVVQPAIQDEATQEADVVDTQDAEDSQEASDADTFETGNIGTSLMPMATNSIKTLYFTTSGNTQTATSRVDIKNYNTDYPYKFTLTKDCKVVLTGTTTKEVRYELRNANNTTSFYYNFIYEKGGLMPPLDGTWYLHAGTYYLDFWAGELNNQFDFTLTVTPSSVSFQDSSSNTDSLISGAHSISIGKTYTGQLSLVAENGWKRNDNDFYKFTITKAGNYLFNVNNPGDSIRFWLYDSEENYIFNEFTSHSSISNTSKKSYVRDNLKAGTYYLCIDGENTPYSFSINNCDLTSATLSGTSFTATGSAITPGVTVYAGSAKLTNGTDYTVSYKNNIKAGTATVTITGKGNYAGTITKTFTITEKAQWVQSNGKWKYKTTSGTYYKNTAATINNQVYRFDSNGYMRTGWIKENSKYYYHASSGVMQKNKWIGNYWVGSNGVMATNSWVDSSKFYVDGNGKWVKGWKQISNKWYYFTSAGKQKSKWVGNYWVDSNGVMATNTWVDGSKYYVNANGAWVKGWKQISNKWYYFSNAGKQKSKWIGNYWVDANGVMATNTWVDGGKYYVDANGKWVPGKKK